MTLPRDALAKTALSVKLRLILCTILSAASWSYALSPLEQISVKTFEAMREVERYQLKIAEKHYTGKDYKTALAEYENSSLSTRKAPVLPTLSSCGAIR